MAPRSNLALLLVVSAPVGASVVEVVGALAAVVVAVSVVPGPAAVSVVTGSAVVPVDVALSVVTAGGPAQAQTRRHRPGGTLRRM